MKSRTCGSETLVDAQFCTGNGETTYALGHRLPRYLLHHFLPTGRIGREVFAVTSLTILGTAYALVYAIAAVNRWIYTFRDTAMLDYIIGTVFVVAALLIGLQVIKRLHDFERSAWHILWFLVPIWGLFEVFKALFVKGHGGWSHDEARDSYGEATTSFIGRRRLIGWAIVSVFVTLFAGSWSLYALGLADGDSNELMAIDYFDAGADHIARGRFAEAIEQLDEAIRLKPNWSEALASRGVARHSLNQFEAAIRNYDEYIKLVPDDDTYFSLRARAYQKLGRPDLAIVDYTKAILLGSGHASDLNNRADAYADLGEFERAVEDYDRAIRLEPENPSLYYNRGTTYSELGRFDEAIRDHSDAIRLDSDYGVAYYNRGRAYFERGELQSALKDFETSIQIDPIFSEAYGNRGSVYLKLGETERAVEDFSLAIRFDGENAIAYFNRGSAYLLLGALEQARDDITQALSRPGVLGSHVSLAYANRGSVFLGLEQPELAIADYSQAMGGLPDQTELYVGRAIAYAQLGRDSDAQRDVDELVRLGFDVGELNQIISELKSGR